MADNVKKNPDTGDTVEVATDEVISPGDPRWGVHNPQVGPRDTLAEAGEEVDTSAVQVDIPQEDPPASDELYFVEPEEQASQKEAEAASKSSSKSDSSSKS